MESDPEMTVDEGQKHSPEGDAHPTCWTRCKKVLKPLLPVSAMISTFALYICLHNINVSPVDCNITSSCTDTKCGELHDLIPSEVELGFSGVFLILMIVCELASVLLTGDGFVGRWMVKYRPLVVIGGAVFSACSVASVHQLYSVLSAVPGTCTSALPNGDWLWTVFWLVVLRLVLMGLTICLVPFLFQMDDSRNGGWRLLPRDLMSATDTEKEQQANYLCKKAKSDEMNAESVDDYIECLRLTDGYHPGAWERLSMWVKAAELHPGLQLGVSGLKEKLQAKGIVQLEGIQILQWQHLLDPALERNLKNAVLWCLTGVNGGHRVSDTWYSPQECFLKAVEYKMDYAEAWWGLSTVLKHGQASLDIQGVTESLTITRCCEMALKYDLKLRGAWYSLGSAGGGSVGGQWKTETDCFMTFVALLRAATDPETIDEIVYGSLKVKHVGERTRGILHWSLDITHRPHTYLTELPRLLNYLREMLAEQGTTANAQRTLVARWQKAVHLGRTLLPYWDWPEDIPGKDEMTRLQGKTDDLYRSLANIERDFCRMDREEKAEASRAATWVLENMEMLPGGRALIQHVLPYALRQGYLPTLERHLPVDMRSQIPSTIPDVSAARHFRRGTFDGSLNLEAQGCLGLFR